MLPNNLPTPAESYLTLWAKTDDKNAQRYHRLLYHLIDVGQVAHKLWQEALPLPQCTAVAAQLGLDPQTAAAWVAFWAAMHDLGKASPAFQFKHAASIPRLRQAGLPLDDHYWKPTPHATFTAWTLFYEPDLVVDLLPEARDRRQMAQLLSGHHGVWQSSYVIDNVPPNEAGVGPWTTARAALVRDLRAIFGPPPAQLPAAIDDRNSLLTLLSGFVCVSDWLGSSRDFFPVCDELLTPSAYAAHAANLAANGLANAGWLNVLPTPSGYGFQQLFGIPTPTPLQTDVINLAGALAGPRLVILEAPTGCGKTEAALGLYAQWSPDAAPHGLYVAMPTTATSDQMHGRVSEFLSRRHAVDVAPLLIHSRARLQPQDGRPSDSPEQAADQSWFLPRKKSLLARFGVGTVDQALLSVLQTRHFFVRLFGLSHKVVIFDEVHAYDAYMSEIFCRLLAWLRRLNTSVILLSATLPAEARRRFAEAYGDAASFPEVSYPRLTVVSPAGVTAHQLPYDPNQRPPLGLEWMRRDVDTLVTRVQAEIATGGCIAVICNTVRRAQQVYRALAAANQQHPFCPADKLLLFHARTTQAWRLATQETVLGWTEKSSREEKRRPERLVVVATQVIEQSLDLDFDVMISDIAPLDLLVQRAGRLQRHPPQTRRWPYRLLLTAPDLQGDVPQFVRTEFPYANYFMLRTWLALQGRTRLDLVREAPAAIEAVYTLDPLPGLSPTLEAAMARARQDYEKDRANAETEARASLVPEPISRTLVAKSNRELEEDNPSVGQALQALTRRDASGVTLICLFQVGAQVCLDPEGQQPVNHLDPSPPDVTELAWNAINVSNRGVQAYFVAQKPPPSWSKIAALRYARLLILDPARGYDGAGFHLSLTRPLGLEIEKLNRAKSGGTDANV